jgi:hypothetical protein
MPKSIKGCLTLVLGIGFIAGCTSVNDFKKMSSGERTEFVCFNDDDVSNHRKTVEENEDLISRTKNAIRRGYWITEQCSDEKIVYPKTYSTDCSTHFGQTSCTTVANPTYLGAPQTKRVCTNVRTHLDVVGEQARIKVLQDEIDLSLTEGARIYNICQTEVRSMSAERAFKRFQDRTTGHHFKIPKK